MLFEIALTAALILLIYPAWSAPRIFRIPSADEVLANNPDEDKYVAVMGGGMGNTNLCAGSAVFIVDLDNPDAPGSIYGAEANGGPITIVDTDPSGIAAAGGTIATPNGSDIGNSLAASPVAVSYTHLTLPTNREV